MSIDLHLTVDGIPVCEAHLEKYLDAPSFLACPCDYDAWFHSHGQPMTCQRCKGNANERDRDSMDASFLDTDSPEGRRRTASGRALDEEIVRHFSEYISHASYSE